jgi:hypothetical protein
MSQVDLLTQRLIQLDPRFDDWAAPGDILAIRICVIRAIRGETISTFLRRAFGKRDRCATNPKPDRV